MRGWTGGSDDWQCQKRQIDPAEWGLMIWNQLLQFAGLQWLRVAQSQLNGHSWKYHNKKFTSTLQKIMRVKSVCVCVCVCVCVLLSLLALVYESCQVIDSPVVLFCSWFIGLFPLSIYSHLEWLNEWCIYIVLYCVLLYTQSALQSWGLSSTTTSVQHPLGWCLPLICLIESFGTLLTMLWALCCHVCGFTIFMWLYVYT